MTITATATITLTLFFVFQLQAEVDVGLLLFLLLLRVMVLLLSQCRAASFNRELHPTLERCRRMPVFHPLKRTVEAWRGPRLHVGGRALTDVDRWEAVARQWAFETSDMLRGSRLGCPAVLLPCVCPAMRFQSWSS